MPHTLLAAHRQSRRRPPDHLRRGRAAAGRPAAGRRVGPRRVGGPGGSAAPAAGAAGGAGRRRGAGEGPSCGAGRRRDCGAPADEADRDGGAASAHVVAARLAVSGPGRAVPRRRGGVAAGLAALGVRGARQLVAVRPWTRFR